MESKELIDFINNIEPMFSLHEIKWCDEIDAELIAEGLDLDQHRWYSIATNVYECIDGLVGVRGPYQSFSEHQDFSDIGIYCVAGEMIAVPSVTYEWK